MPDRPKDADAAETPMQRALRLKKAALEAKQTPAGDKLTPARATRAAPGASKPWMKR